MLLFSIPFLEMPKVNIANGTETAWYAFVIIFKAAEAPVGLSRKKFVAELHSRGLLDVDIPRSTGLLHQEPLYNRPHDSFPYLYKAQDFPLDYSTL